MTLQHTSRHLDALDRIFGEVDDLLADHQSERHAGYMGEIVWRVGDATIEAADLDDRPDLARPEAARDQAKARERERAVYEAIEQARRQFREPAPAGTVGADLGLHLGDVFYSSWGYDQTNIDFYEIVGFTPKMVRFRRVRSVRVEALEGGHDHVMPAFGEFFEADGTQYGDERAKTLTRRVSAGYRGAPWASKLGYGGGSLWDGTPCYETAAGWGH